MSNNITVITQEEFEPKELLPAVNLTMVIPHLATLSVPQFPKKKLLQMTMFGRVAPPSPETKNTPVQGHNHSSTQVQFHLCKIKANSHGNKKDSKTIKSKKKIGKSKQSAFHKMQDDCKESVQLAKTLHIRDLANSLTNNSRNHYC
jgi:hypothetical protein